MHLSQILFSQGFGTRRECDGLIHAGLVAHAGKVIDEPDVELDTAGLVLRVQGQDWLFQAKALLMLNKPAGYECSQRPKHHPSVLSLLPPPLRHRGVQPVGRLDEDTTGLLLMTDDGALIHRLTSPKHHVPKVYEVGCKHPVDARQVDALLAGVLLHDENETVRAAACEATGASSMRLTLVEGKYHQVKRMIAAAGNRVEALQRSAFGPVSTEGLIPGGWRWLTDVETSALSQKSRAGAER